MTNKSNNPKIRTDADGRPLTPEEISYQDGYSQGRGSEDEIQYQRERAAENSGAASGLVIGGILATLVGLGTAYYYWGQPAPAPTTVINNPPSPAPVAPQKQTTIIDRTVEKAAPPQVKVVEVEKRVPVPGATKVIEVEKRVPVPGATKVIEVEKRVPVPGATKVIEVPKPVIVPAATTPATKSEPTKDNPSNKESSSPATAPTPAASNDSEPKSSPAPNPDAGNN
ncbi:hypothetical protein [Chamaesiphon sp. GL140_3_metabinner_50]|uniref:hypothetical protein n=1 Tax=Chamaesiphon sp. GL140_3_metabinner_50 TaxID=2970812 RepID=UPI0025D37149|nr:hypothetical protein [Chamaesiphon sp. GL140_3_metabinner_50]